MARSSSIWKQLNEVFGQLHTSKLEDIKQIVFALPLDTRIWLTNTSVSIVDGVFTFCRLEKAYAVFQFLGSKSFFSRKEDFVGSYSALQSAFEQVADPATTDGSSPDYRLAMHLAAICGVRVQLVRFYQSIHENPTKLFMQCSTLCDKLKQILTELDKSESFEHDLTTQFPTIRCELNILANLLQAQLFTADLHFLDGLLCFTSVFDELDAVKKKGALEVMSTKPGKPKQMTVFGWLNIFYDTLLAKYTLYWFHILSQSVSDNTELMDVIKYEDPCLVDKLLDFHSHSKALYSSLFFDTGCQSYPFLGHGYVLRGTVGEGPKGIDSIPPIFTAPLGQSLPSSDLCAIVMHITGGLNLGNPDEFSKLVYAFDEKLNHTYFIRKMEFRVFLVLVYEGCRPQRDRQINEFMTSFASIVRLNNLCSQMSSN